MSELYSCDKCGKTYKSRTGLWKHSQICVIDIIQENNKYICNFCYKQYGNKYSKYKHQKKCELKNNRINDIEEEITKLKTKLEIVSNKPATINNINNIHNIKNINKGVINYIKPPGSEDISVITEQEAEKILENEMNCLIALVDYVNFNENYPENHSFCTTALNDKYISTINTETLMIEKQRKKDFFDLMLSNSLKVINMLYEKLKNKKNPKALKYKENIDKLTNFVVVNNKGKKAYMEMMNTLSFNKRHLTQTTWDQLINNEIPIKPVIEYKETKPITNQTLPTQQIQQAQPRQKLIPDMSDSDSELSDSSNDSKQNDNEDEDSGEESDEPIEMKVQGTMCLLDGINLYKMTKEKQKGELYATFINGKVRKIKKTDIEV
jgi:hypothetical protein